LARAGALGRLEVFRDIPVAFRFSSALDGGSTEVFVAGGSLAGAEV
jgi:hypothetical protein